MESVPVQHFLSIVEEPLVDRCQFINNSTKHILKLVTKEDNHNINGPVSEEEVSEVINEMQNGKARALMISMWTSSKLARKQSNKISLKLWKTLGVPKLF